MQNELSDDDSRANYARISVGLYDVLVRVEEGLMEVVALVLDAQLNVGRVCVTLV